MAGELGGQGLKDALVILGAAGVVIPAFARLKISAISAPALARADVGLEVGSLTESVTATLAALSGEGTAESIAPDQIVTPRAAAHIGHFWSL